MEKKRDLYSCSVNSVHLIHRLTPSFGSRQLRFYLTCYFGSLHTAQGRERKLSPYEVPRMLTRFFRPAPWIFNSCFHTLVCDKDSIIYTLPDFSRSDVTVYPDDALWQGQCGAPVDPDVALNLSCPCGGKKYALSTISNNLMNVW